MLRNTPIIQGGLDNAILKGKGAMPQKDITSSSDSQFSNGRKLFSEYFTNSVSNTKLKRFYGNSQNHDASRRIETIKTNAIGSSINVSGSEIAYTSNEKNTTREALKRVRSGGSVAPAKKTHLYTNPPIFY